MNRATLLVAAILPLAGCATKVPRIANLGQTDEGHYVDETNLILHIKCELRDAVWKIADLELANPGVPESKWLKGWGAKVTMKLVVEEKAALSPSFAFTNPMRNVIKTFPSGGPVTVGQSQATAFGASIGSAATRTETVGFYYSFANLLADGRVTEPCSTKSDTLLRGDLKIAQFMQAKILASQNPGLIPREPDASPFDTFTYQVGFVITKTANLTPGWKLQYYLINPTAPLLNGSRAQTHDLTLTMGPVQKDDAGNPGPSDAVRDAHLAAMIGDEVARALGTLNP